MRHVPRTTVLLCLLATAFTAACGTRVERAEPLGTQPTSVGRSADTNAAAGNPTLPGGGSASAAPAAGGQATAASAGGQPTAAAAPGLAPVGGVSTGSSPRSGAVAVGGVAASGSSPSAAVSRPTGAGNGKAGSDVGGPAPGGATSVPGSAPPASGGGLSPVKLGSVSTLSGPIGATIGGFVKGFQIWVRWINDRGGVNGHPVVLKIWDDGADPARHRAQVQDAVETANVIALVSEAAPTTGEGSLEYLKSKGIPVIGTETGSQWPEKSPLYFMQAAWGKGVVYISASAAVRRAAVSGAKKFGTITCTEASECALHERYWHQYATAAGLSSVYKARSSLVQPDFTAECLAARNAGVELLGITMDTNSVPRIAASCIRQGYHPTYILLGPLMVSQLTKDPNLDGAVLGTAQFPYVWTDNSKVAEFLAAMKTYTPGVTPGPSEAGGWVTAKLFERAAASTPEPPTTAALLDGLWSIKNDSLGGITEPLTFSKGQPSSQNPSCGFDMVLDHGAWKSPDGFKIQCGNPA